METLELANRAMAELAPLGNGLGLRAAMQVAETDALAPHMLSALLGHELVAGHAAMMKLSAKIDRWLALVADDRSPQDQERGSREAVRLAVAAARLSERYRVGLVSLARLRGWEGFRSAGAPASAAELAAALAGDDGLDNDPGDDPDGGPGGGTRAMLRAIRQLQTLNRAYGAGLGNGHANGAATPNGTPTPPPAARARRGRLRHGNPSGDLLAAPRCGARTRAHCPCRQPAMANGRCRLHGGKSTGARTAAGLARVRANRLVHGARSAEIIDLRSAAARHGRTLRALARLAQASAKPRSERSTPCPATTVSPRHADPAAFDRLRLRGNLGGPKKAPHPEPVEGRTPPLPRSGRANPGGAKKAPHPEPAEGRTPPIPQSERPTPCQARPRRVAAG